MKYSLWIAVIVVAVIAIGGYFYPKAQSILGSAVGTTFGTAKVAMVNISPATQTATSSSVLNTDASARYVESLEAGCTGVGSSFTDITGTGLSSLTITAATTTAASEGSQGNTNTFTGTVATTTAFSWLSSVIASTGTADNYYWPAGTYLTFTFNATNTAACTVGVHYIGS